MSQRQYVGARYVPKFADPIEWDNNRTYEALTVVTHNGGSYTSKKPVPIGANITDEDYWVLTSNYNAQFEAYRKMVESEIDVKKKRILVIGDSYNDQSRSQYATNGVTVWGVQAMSILGVENYTNIGISGAGWIHANNEGKRFIDALVEASASGNYTDIIVGGGLNDVIHYDSAQNPMSAIGEFITLAKSKYPGVKIHIGVLGYAYNKRQVNEYTYVKNIRENKNGLDFSYITNLEYAIRGIKWLLDDKLHPNQNASTRIANGVVQHMLGSVATYSDAYTYNVPMGTDKYLQVLMYQDNETFVVKSSEVDCFNVITLNSSGVYAENLGILPNYDFTGMTPSTAFRLICGCGITCVGKPSEDAPIELLYGTIRFEPLAVLSSTGDLTGETGYKMQLTLRKASTGLAASNYIIPARGIRFPFVTGMTDALTM